MPEPIRIAHTADLHFGRRMSKNTRQGENVRELDIYKSASVVANYIAYTLQPDAVVVAGDVWDTSHPTPLAVRHGFDFHQTIRSADIPCLVIGGNHDTLASLGRPSPLDHLARYFDCKLALEQTEIEIAGIRFCCLPYRTLSTGATKAFEYSKEQPNVLVVHATADGEGLPDFAKYDLTRCPRSLLLDPAHCLRLLGHIHIHQEIAERSYYSGALERLTWGELGNEPAIYLHEVYPDGEVKTQTILIKDMGVENVPRPALNLNLDCGDLSADEVIEKAQSLLEEAALDEALVQLRLHQAPREIYGIHYEEALNKRALKRGAFALRVKVKVKDGEELLKDNENPIAEPVPGAALSEAYKQFALSRGEQELVDLGSKLIAVVSGEDTE